MADLHLTGKLEVDGEIVEVEFTSGAPSDPDRIVATLTGKQWEAQGRPDVISTDAEEPSDG